MQKLSRYFLFLMLLVSGQLTAQSQYYGAAREQYPRPESPLEGVPKPEAVLGFQIGAWHVTHDQMVRYLQALEEASDRVQLIEYARSIENRPLYLVAVSSPQNLKNLDKIREDHLKLTDPEKSKGLNTENMPVVLYQGFSVHGNEASGGNAALWYAWFLAAENSAQYRAELEKSVILIDPCLNPDGFNRFAQWVNSHRSLHPDPHSRSREHNEVWPGGRTNHYWFDLNRDWLPLVMPESQGRLRMFHTWKPNVLTDHHEMGRHSTFFFQPGVPSRTNPMTPPENQKMTAKIGEFHAGALDKIGSSYYTKENFDDFYYGKGSTYPDVNGSIGILFEQASARGHVQESDHGELDFFQAVLNQITTAFSTREAGLNMRTDLLNYQREFYREALQEGKADAVKGYVVSSADGLRLHQFLKVLDAHKIKIYSLPKTLEIEGKQFPSETSWLIPSAQPQYRLVKALFEERTEFTDSLFYDVSAWTFPLAFGVDYAELKRGFPEGVWLQKPWAAQEMRGKVLTASDQSVAWLFPPGQMGLPRFLGELFRNGIQAEVCLKPTQLPFGSAERFFSPGTIVISRPKHTKGDFGKWLADVAEKNGLIGYGSSTSLAVQGIDLGSPSIRPIRSPKILLLAGEGSSGYEVGEIWHSLDRYHGLPVTVAEMEQVGRMKLHEFNTLVLASGSFRGLNSGSVEKIRDWVRGGGLLICQRGGASWAARQGLANIETRSVEDTTSGPVSYSKLNRDLGAKVVGGAIVEANADLSHPLLFGFREARIPLFRRDTKVWEVTKNRYATPLIYTDSPLRAGYMSTENQENLAGGAALIVSGLGAGRVICFADNPNFRGFWRSTEQLFLNALFFGPMIDGRGIQRAE